MSGLGPSREPRYHWDIYAIVVGPQELYFGHETQVNVNLVEVVTLPDKTERCYISPTKRRGVERRSLLWSPARRDGQHITLGEKLSCGIPNTCGKEGCPICRVYGALVTETRGERERTTFIGRLTHGGGVAVQALEVSEKQRAMHPSDLRRGAGEGEPQPFKRQYNEPGLYYPISNHLISASEEEFSAAAYAFLESLARLGAGNPKGATLLRNTESRPFLVVDRYLSPMGARVILNPEVARVVSIISFSPPLKE